MKGAIAGFLAGAVIGGGGIAAAAVAHRDVPRWMNRPCATEDSYNCVWDGSERGNGHGATVYIRRIPHSHGLTCILHVERPRLDWCGRNF